MHTYIHMNLVNDAVEEADEREEEDDRPTVQCVVA